MRAWMLIGVKIHGHAVARTHAVAAFACERANKTAGGDRRTGCSCLVALRVEAGRAPCTQGRGRRSTGSGSCATVGVCARAGGRVPVYQLRSSAAASTRARARARAQLTTSWPPGHCQSDSGGSTRAGLARAHALIRRKRLDATPRRAVDVTARCAWPRRPCCAAGSGVACCRPSVALFMLLCAAAAAASATTPPAAAAKLPGKLTEPSGSDRLESAMLGRRARAYLAQVGGAAYAAGADTHRNNRHILRSLGQRATLDVAGLGTMSLAFSRRPPSATAASRSMSTFSCIQSAPPACPRARARTSRPFPCRVAHRCSQRSPRRRCRRSPACARIKHGALLLEPALPARPPHPRPPCRRRRHIEIDAGAARARCMWCRNQGVV